MLGKPQEAEKSAEKAVLMHFYFFSKVISNRRMREESSLCLNAVPEEMLCKITINRTVNELRETISTAPLNRVPSYYPYSEKLGIFNSLLMLFCDGDSDAGYLPQRNAFRCAEYSVDFKEDPSS